MAKIRLYHRKRLLIIDANEENFKKILAARRMVIIDYGDFYDFVCGDGVTKLGELPSLVRREFPNINNAIIEAQELQHNVNTLNSIVQSGDLSENINSTNEDLTSLIGEFNVLYDDKTNRELDKRSRIIDIEHISSQLSTFQNRLSFVTSRSLGIRSNFRSHVDSFYSLLNDITNVLMNINDRSKSSGDWIENTKNILHERILSHINSANNRLAFLEDVIGYYENINNEVEDLVLRITNSENSLNFRSENLDSDISEQEYRLVGTDGDFESLDNRVDYLESDLNHIGSEESDSLVGYRDSIRSLKSSLDDIESSLEDIDTAINKFENTFKLYDRKYSWSVSSTPEGLPIDDDVLSRNCYIDPNTKKVHMRTPSGWSETGLRGRIRIYVDPAFMDPHRDPVFVNEQEPIDNFNIESFSNDFVSLSWSKPALLSEEENITYLIYRDGNLLSSISNKNTLNYVDTTVEPDTNYEYDISAMDRFYFNLPLQKIKREVLTMYDDIEEEPFDRQPIKSVTYNNLTDGSVEIEWDPVEGDVEYVIERFKIDGDENVVLYTGEDTVFVDNSVEPETTYIYSIYAIEKE